MLNCFVDNTIAQMSIEIKCLFPGYSWEYADIRLVKNELN